MSNLSVSKVQRKTKNDPWPTLSENFNSHPLEGFIEYLKENKSLYYTRGKFEKLAQKFRKDST
jgi:hypothetical protein